MSQRSIQQEAVAAPVIPRTASPKAEPYVTFVVPHPTEESHEMTKFNVQLSDGRVFTVSTPEGCYPGDTVHAIIVDDVNGSATLRLIPPPRKAAVNYNANADGINMGIHTDQDEMSVDGIHGKFIRFC